MDRLLPAEPDRLLRLARAGCGTALGQLLEGYRSYLALLARVQIGRRLQDKADAADLVQETFLAAHRHFGTFRGTCEPEFLAWLRRILASRVAKLVRRYCGTRRRDVRLERQLTADLEHSSECLASAVAAAQSTPSQRAARRELAVLLAAALERLPPDYREVLVLRHLEERSFPEVARHMGRSLDSVKNLWLRALARLRAAVGEVP
jgi:RNA polymerase sigma-70 factor (ECF subfamily)